MLEEEPVVHKQQQEQGVNKDPERTGAGGQQRLRQEQGVNRDSDRSRGVKRDLDRSRGVNRDSDRSRGVNRDSDRSRSRGSTDTQTGTEAGGQQRLRQGPADTG